MTEGRLMTTACPSCGAVAERRTYDIGDGPELSCASCEWCWGADGQTLRPYTYARVVEALGYDPLARAASKDPADPGDRD